MAEPLCLAVLGTGSISIRGILPPCTMRDVQDRLRATAVCDTVPGRAKAAAEKFGVRQAFDDYERTRGRRHGVRTRRTIARREVDEAGYCFYTTDGTTQPGWRYRDGHQDTYFQRADLHR